MFRPLSRRFAKLFKNAQKPTRRADRLPRFNVEYLEDRVVPADFTITGNTLTISLGVGQTLTVTDTAGATTTFSVDVGNFVQMGGTAPAQNNTTNIVVNDADLANALIINNAVAAANTNNTTNGVIFSGNGTTDNVTSNTISVAIADADGNTDVDNVDFAGLRLITDATGTVSITTANGSITSTGGGLDVDASQLTLIASALIGASLNPITTTVANVEASSPGTNGINIANTTSAARPSLTIGSTSAAISGISSGGPVSVTSALGTGDGDLIVGEGVTVTGNISLSADRNVTVNAPVMGTGTGTLTIVADADNSGGAMGGNIVSATQGTISTAGGSISIGPGGVAMGGAQLVDLDGAVTVTGGTTGTILIQAETNAVLDAAVTRNGGMGGITVSAGNSVSVNAAVAVAMTGTGTITVIADNDDAGGGDITSTTAGTISTAGGSISIGPGGVAMGGAQLVDLDGAVTVTGGTTGTILIQAETNAVLDAAVTRNGGMGGITVNAQNNVSVNAAVAVAMTGTGGITITADSDNLGNGNFTSVMAGTLNTLGGDIIVDGGDGNLTLGGAVSSTVGGNITLTTDDNNILVNAMVTASGGNGNIIITANDDLNLNAAVSAAGTGDITLTTGVAGPDNFTSVAAGTVMTATGDIIIQATSNVAIGGAVTVTGGTGTITVIADTNNSGAGNVTSTAAGDISTGGGAINIGAAAGTAVLGAVAQDVILAGDLVVTGGTGGITVRGENNVTLSGAVNVANTTGLLNITANDDGLTNGVLTTLAGGTLTTQAGNINLVGNDVDLGAAVTTTATTAPANPTVQTNSVNIAPRIANSPINLGTDGAGAQDFGLTGLGATSDLNRITTGIIRVGNTTGTPPVSGAITVTAPVVLTSTSTLALQTGANILDGTVAEATDVTVTNLAIRSATGVGSADAIDTAVTNLALVNTTSGNVFVSNTSATLNITTVDGLVGAVQQSGNVAGTDDLAIVNTGNIVVQQNVTNVGNTPTADVQLSAGGNLTVNTGLTVQAGTTTGGNIFLDANFNNPTGTADIVLQTNSSVRTAGDIVVAADQNGAATVGGGMVTMNTGTQIAGPGGTRANNVTITGGEDVLVTSVLATTNITAASGAALIDDSVETTLLDSLGSINLTGGGRIGGQLALTPAEIIAAAGPNYTAMIDVAYGTTLGLNQVNTLGNVQVRKVGGTLVTGDIMPGTPLIGSGNQLTVVSTGPVSVAGNFTLADGNLLIATAEAANNITFTAAGSITNNGPMSTSTLLAAGGAGAAIINAGANDGTANFAGTNLVLSSQGGPIGDLVNPIEIDARSGNLSGDTTLGGGTGAGFFVTDTLNGLRVGQVNAGTAGNVTLNSLANLTPTGSNIVAVTPNDGIAEVIGNIVNLNTNFVTAPPTGVGGQIGAAGQFFEVDANILGATANQSNVYLSAVGTNKTTSVSTITAGTNAGLTAFLRTANGATLTSLAVDNTADIIAPNVNLSNVAGSGGGNFGTDAVSPLEIDPAVLVATLGGGGRIFVRDTSNGLIVQQASTTTGNIGIETVGPGLPNLTLGNANTVGPAAVSTGGTTAANGTVTLTAELSILAGAGNPVADVAGLVLTATAASGIASTADPLITILGTATTAGTLGAVTTLGQVGVTNNSPGAALTLNNISGSGDVQIITINSAAAGENLTVNTGQTVNSVLANVTLTAADNLILNGAVTANSGVIQAAVNLNAGGSLTANSGGTVSATGLATLDAGTGLTLNTGSGVTSVGATLDAGTGVLMSSAAVNATTGAASLTGTGLTLNTGGTVTGVGATLDATTGALASSAAVNAGVAGAASLTGTGLTLNAGGTVTGATATLSAGTGALMSSAAVQATNGLAQLTAGTDLTTFAGGTVSATGATLTATNGAMIIGATVGAGTGIAALEAGTSLTTNAAVTATGAATLETNNGVLQTNANVSGSTVSLTANDVAGLGQDVFVAAGTVTGANGVTVMAGDDVTVLGVISTGAGAGTISISADGGAADGVGATVGIATGTLTSLQTVTVAGGSDPDTFDVAPQTGAALSVAGGLPVAPANPGDTLLVDTTGATPAVLMTTGVGAGTYTFGGGRQSITFTGIETPATATVSITANDPTASEGPAVNPGQFTVTRVGDTTVDLTVNLMIAGTATNGADYAGIPATVVIPAGMATATINVSVLADALTEGNETVIVTVITGTGYAIDAANSGTVTIADNPPPPPAPPAPVPPPPVYTGAAIINGVLVLAGPNGSTAATLPVPAGSSVLFTDLTGDGKGDVILFLPGIVVVLSGANGVIVAFGGDVNGDQVPDLLIFNFDTGAPKSFTNGRTGQTIPLGN